LLHKIKHQRVLARVRVSLRSEALIVLKTGRKLLGECQTVGNDHSMIRTWMTYAGCRVVEKGRPFLSSIFYLRNNNTSSCKNDTGIDGFFALFLFD